MKRIVSKYLDGRLLCIDPSKPGNNTGVAVFESRVLVQCALWGEKLAAAERCEVLVIELPQVYPGAREEDPNDLIQVARSVGMWEQATECNEVYLVHPRKWKGTVAKEIHNRRTLAKLEPRERALLEALYLPASKRHNVIDAIALGLWATGRMR